MWEQAPGEQKTVRGPPSEEEGLEEAILDELTSALIPHSPVPLQVEEVEEIRKSEVKLHPGRMEGWGIGVLRFAGYFSLTYSDFIGNEFNIFPESALPVMVPGG